MADEQLTAEQEAAQAAEAEAARVAAEGEDGETGKKGPNGWIPKQRLDEVLGDVRELKTKLEQEKEERIRLEERLKKDTKPVKYTRQNYRDAVAAGQMTQEQADDAWDAQRESEIVERARNEVGATLSESNRAQSINDGLTRYKTAVPDLLTPGSENRQKIEDEYQFLISVRGKPANQLEKHAMELAAARAAFGPIERLEQKRGRVEHESHQESGGGGKKPEGGKKSLLDQAPERYQTYLKDEIAKGRLTVEKAEKQIERIGLKALNERAKRYG